jgi:hypothetical protein
MKLLCKSGFLGLVHRLYFNKITTFRKLDLLSSQVERYRSEASSTRGPTARVSVLFT